MPAHGPCWSCEATSSWWQVGPGEGLGRARAGGRLAGRGVGAGLSCWSCARTRTFLFSVCSWMLNEESDVVCFHSAPELLFLFV